MTPDDFRKGVFALFLLSIWVQFVCIMKQTNWTQMLNRKSANTPLLWLILACALSLKRVFSEFLEAQLRSSKGVFVLSTIEHLGPILSASCCQIKGNMILKSIF